MSSAAAHEALALAGAAHFWANEVFLFDLGIVLFCIEGLYFHYTSDDGNETAPRRRDSRKTPGSNRFLDLMALAAVLIWLMAAAWPLREALADGEAAFRFMVLSFFSLSSWLVGRYLYWPFSSRQ